MSETYLEIQLEQQPIELYKLLKITNLVSGGGEAKVVISEGYVFLNGEVEYQKRKKVYHDDIIEFNGETLKLIVNEDLKDELNEEQSEQSTPKKSPKNNIDREETPVKPVANEANTTKKNRRKPISF